MYGGKVSLKLNIRVKFFSNNNNYNKNNNKNQFNSQPTTTQLRISKFNL